MIREHPVLVQEWEAGRKERFRAVTLWMFGLLLALSLPPAVVAAFLSAWIMSLYGHGFRPRSRRQERTATTI